MSAPLYAILLDGGFLTKKLYSKHGRHATADDVVGECTRLQSLPFVSRYELLRIYCYDAPPSSEAVNKPISKKHINLATTERYRRSQSLYDQLVLKPYLAVRMGETKISANKWTIKSQSANELIDNPRALTDDDFGLNITQKGVDMRIGLDMARLALRETVRAVIVVTGDSDFVPAFKFIRREGVKVIFDPMGHNVRPELRAHADIVVS
jgi:uncharacterized LabA/DUF88 family protein